MRWSLGFALILVLLIALGFGYQWGNLFADHLLGVS